jgi:hypothetical protein
MLELNRQRYSADLHAEAVSGGRTSVTTYLCMLQQMVPPRAASGTWHFSRRRASNRLCQPRHRKVMNSNATASKELGHAKQARASQWLMPAPVRSIAAQMPAARGVPGSASSMTPRPRCAWWRSRRIACATCSTCAQRSCVTCVLLCGARGGAASTWCARLAAPARTMVLGCMMALQLRVPAQAPDRVRDVQHLHGDVCSVA